MLYRVTDLSIVGCVQRYIYQAKPLTSAHQVGVYAVVNKW